SSLAEAAARGGGSSAGGGGLSGSAGASARGAQLAGGGLGQAAGARSRFYGLIFGPAKMILKLCAACVCFALLFKMLGKIDCASKKMDPRRWCKCCARQLMAMGWDEFESFDASVRVHSVADIANKGMLGGEKEFRVTIRFKWSKFDTPPTRDMKWESIKTMEVPQGAHECTIALYSLGKFRDTCLGKIELETKKDMIDKPDFWGKKQKFKLEKSGKEIGKILITFYKKGDGDGDDDGEGGGSMPEVPVDGVDSDSALALEIQLAIEELEKVPGFVKPAGKWEGQNKIIMLARVLEGQLREVNKKGKETGKVYIAIRYCNISELFGDEDNRREELKRQKEKAKQKGLPEVQKKWYWAWYDDKKSAKDDKGWHHPVGFFPMTAITSVHSSPERSDQFIIKYSNDGEKDSLIYRRESGKGRDVWIEGIDMCFQEVRNMVKEQKDKPNVEADALKRMRVLHQQYVAQVGMPQTTEQWTAWMEAFKQNNYSEDLIRKFHAELSAQHQKAAKQAASAPKQKPKARR
ncbi:unnamed protein product, partial [Prorocentrum cordatum]